MHIIVVFERMKDAEKVNIDDLKNNLAAGLKEDYKKNMISQVQFNPTLLYQKRNFISFFFAFDKKYQTDILMIKNNINNQIKKLKLENTTLYDLKQYIDFFGDMTKNTDKNLPKLANE